MRQTDQANLFLQSVPAADRRLLMRDMTPFDVVFQQHLCAPGKIISKTFFPTGAVISAQYRSHGKIMDVYGVGREGLVGTGVLFTGAMRYDMVCQVAGGSLCMPSKTFAEHLKQNTGLRRAVAAYSSAAVLALAQSVACSGLHAIASRCARLLLVTADRVGSEHFALTHEILARMLGVRRAGVSVAMRPLMDRRIIGYRLGTVRILNRTALEAAACPCYPVPVA